jgi:hypothetical protein
LPALRFANKTFHGRATGPNAFNYSAGGLTYNSHPIAGKVAATAPKTKEEGRIPNGKTYGRNDQSHYKKWRYTSSSRG